ncbi:MAG: sodium ion-translocating decarboxylase subunit beta, partial [Verrucomicrobiales bacterium]|nr:sodium ion-translocating decarboxylase subunit beta [Verrucomicrobiales bacterium]
MLGNTDRSGGLSRKGIVWAIAVFLTVFWLGGTLRSWALAGDEAKGEVVEVTAAVVVDGASAEVSEEPKLLRLWQSTGLQGFGRQETVDGETERPGIANAAMICVGLLLIYLGISKGFEPLLLIPIGFGGILANIPYAGVGDAGGFLYLIYEMGIKTGLFPLLIFLGVGAMTDFGPLIANPKMALLGAAAQTGIFATLIGALWLSGAVESIDFSVRDASAIGIIGGADGPTAIF